ncbi:biopolymer transporter Tol [Oleiharenicola lentus]|uniref:biopolymer transporter Tol n=1 Tax=Oleiharenicola lentus TaxID=2508720 RepID=UPI003F660ECF
MHKAFRLILSLACATALVVKSTAQDIGTVKVAAGDAISVSLSASTPELQALARQAFSTHGKFREVATGGAFAIKFTAAGANQVTVAISKGSGGAVHSETVTGANARNALLKAADVAVKKTSGLPGFFAGKIAFVGGKSGKSEIYTSDLFFGDVLRWTSEGKQIVSPRWSPDGSKIVFTSYRTSFPDIYVIDLGTRRISVLVSLKGTNSGGRFSPDGSKVAMVLSGEGNPEVYVGNSFGRQIKRLTRNTSVEASPAWSPDGSRLVFTSDNMAVGRPQLFVMPAGGGTMTRLATNVSGYCAEPDWSAAAPNKIVFTAGAGRGFQIAVHDMTAGSAKIVSKAPADAIEPVWLADGRHVLCTFRAANSTSLWVLDTESGKATRVSPTSFGNAGSASYLAK